MQISEVTATHSISELIPHRPPMQFLKQILAYSSEQIECLVLAGAGAETRSANGNIRIANSIEYMAQACAAFSGLHSRAQSPGEPAQAGVIASVRNLEFFVADIPDATTLRIIAHCAVHSSGLSQFNCEVYDLKSLLARGIFTVLTLKENKYE